MATVLHHSQAAGTAKVVLIGIANHAGDGGAWPSIASLAKYARVDERSVQRAIRKLEELGEIRVHAQSGGTRSTQDRYRPNRYDILVVCPPDCDRSMAHRCADDEAPETAEQDAIRGDADVTPHTETGVTRVSPLALVRGDASVALGVTPVSPEPSYNHPDTPQPPASGGPTSTTPVCGRHPDGGGKNCRACGTTSKQLAEQRRLEAEAEAREAGRRRLAAERLRNEQLRAQGRSPATAAALEQIRQTLAGAR
jgi:hypothetical protein